MERDGKEHEKDVVEGIKVICRTATVKLRKAKRQLSDLECWGFSGIRAEVFQTQKVFCGKEFEISVISPTICKLKDGSLCSRYFSRDLLKVLMAELRRNWQSLLLKSEMYGC